MLTPYELAFAGDDNAALISVDTLLNLCFFVDILINFVSAYYDPDFNLIDDHRVTYYLPFNILQL